MPSCRPLHLDRLEFIIYGYNGSCLEIFEVRSKRSLSHIYMQVKLSLQNLIGCL
jgi:hypothetical protein